MISLAGRDILHSWSKFVLTGLGLGLLIGVTFTMAGVYRGMVDDAKVLLNNSGADLWVVQKDTLGPYAESSSLHDDVYRERPRDARRGAGRQRHLLDDAGPRAGATDVRAMVVGFVPGEPGEPGYLIAGRRVTRSHYEAVADVSAGFAVGDRIRIRRHDYTVVGLTRRMVSSGGDPMVFIPLKDAQEAQFLKDNDAIVSERARTADNPALNRPGVPGLLDAIEASQTSNHNVNAVLVRVAAGPRPGSRRGGAPSLEARAGLHACADGGDPHRQADRHRVEADRDVPGDPDHRQRGHRRVHHLHDDAGQDSRDRRAEADRHAQLDDRQHDPAAGAGAGRDRLRGRQDRRHDLGAGVSALRPARTLGRRASASCIVMLVCVLASTLAIRAALRVDPAAAIGG